MSTDQDSATIEGLRQLALRVQREVDSYAWTKDLAEEWSRAASPKAVLALINEIAGPVPAPEPPSLARLMAEISVTATHEHSPRPSVTWDEMTESGKDLVTASMQAVIDKLGLVCRDEVPTVTQVMEALQFSPCDDGTEWMYDGWGCPEHQWVAERLAAIGVRPDQEGK